LRSGKGIMKEIKAYIRSQSAGLIIKDLEAARAKDLTLIRVEAIRPLPYQAGDPDPASAKHLTHYSTIAKLELVCRAEEVKHFMEIIQARAHTGKRGDGRIFVSNVEEAVNIRTGQTGTTAL
jgi:nitrogen regulatory protein P-II 1